MSELSRSTAIQLKLCFASTPSPALDSSSQPRLSHDNEHAQHGNEIPSMHGTLFEKSVFRYTGIAMSK